MYEVTWIGRRRLRGRCDPRIGHMTRSETLMCKRAAARVDALMPQSTLIQRQYYTILGIRSLSKPCLLIAGMSHLRLFGSYDEE